MVVLAQPLHQSPTSVTTLPARGSHAAFYEADASPEPTPAPALEAVPPVAAPAPTVPAEVVATPSNRAILVNAAETEGVDPNLMLAVSWWESGWHQDRVSSEGAVGLMQVMPKTAAVIGPGWLHRSVDLNDPRDNALLGAALLGDLLHKYDARTALASYYQGEPAIQSGRYAADTWRYADGILGLSRQFAAGWNPPGTD